MVYKYSINNGGTTLTVIFSSIEYDGENEEVASALELLEEAANSAPSEMTETFTVELGDGYILLDGARYNIESDE